MTSTTTTIMKAQHVVVVMKKIIFLLQILMLVVVVSVVGLSHHNLPSSAQSAVVTSKKRPSSFDVNKSLWRWYPSSCNIHLRHSTKEQQDDKTQNIDYIQRSNYYTSSSSRRQFSDCLIALSSFIVPYCVPSVAFATRAVGGAEEDCRAAGNCLEKLELDGAVGWSWGAKDRCDATDPLCGSDGRLLDAPPSGEAVPDTLGLTITHIAQVTLTIGRTERGMIRLGLYGNDSPESVKQFLLFLTDRGLKTTSDLVYENGMGVQAMPVSMTRGGTLGQIVPGQRLDFGIPLQSQAYARSKGLSKAGDDFMPQPRPTELKDVPVLRSHDVAGLVSVPAKGIGYGGSGFESDDECYESAFQITAAPQPAIDKRENRRVIGQVMDASSMTTLARLASLPTKKGFRGVIPGQNSGPPLLRVLLTDVEVQSKADSVVASL